MRFKRTKTRRSALFYRTISSDNYSFTLNENSARFLRKQSLVTVHYMAYEQNVPSSVTLDAEAIP